MAMTASDIQTSAAPAGVPAPAAPTDRVPTRRPWPRRDSLITGSKAVVGILGLLALWELAVAITRPPEYILVGPIAAFAELFSRFDYFATNFIVWFGFGFESKAFVAMAIAFFPLVINTFDGLSTVPHELKELARINKASTWKRLTKIEFIYALPSIFSGAKISISLAVGGAVVGEFIAGSKGLGYVIMLANSQVDLAAMFAAFFVLAAIALVLFFVVDFAGKKLMPWKSHAK
jgi:NitT/TauT family transport system permease protein